MVLRCVNLSNAGRVTELSKRAAFGPPVFVFESKVRDTSVRLDYWRQPATSSS